jgi:hypothetical protein
VTGFNEPEKRTQLSESLVDSRILYDWQVWDISEPGSENPEHLLRQRAEELELELPFLTEFVEQVRRRFQAALALLHDDDAAPKRGRCERGIAEVL